jgi:hypothetical protein
MKGVVVLLWFCFVALNLNAQYNYNKFNYYSLGIKAGPDFYTHTLDPNKKMTIDPTFNMSVGISGAYYVVWYFEVHGSIQYSSRNISFIHTLSTNPDALFLSEYKISYLNIPLEGRFNVLYNNIVKLNLGIGLMPDFRFRPKEFLTYNDGQRIESIKYWSSKNYTKVLFAFPASAHAKFYLDRHYTLEVGGTYYFYMNRMHKEFFTQPSNGLAIRLGVFYEW